MKILMINKFLHPNGGAETYMLQLGAYLHSRGHAVEYFGMDHPRRAVGNRAEAYGPNVDYHREALADKLRGACGAIYSSQVRRKLRQVLDAFGPDVCHVNNFNYQLTPGILLEICKWCRETGRHCPIVYTAHDSQLVCPNHLMRNGKTGENCRQCLGGRYIHCLRGRCIHGSLLKSTLGALEGWFWHKCRVYRHLDLVIAPSRFLARQLEMDPMLRGKILVLPNFVSCGERKTVEKEDYVLYFGRYSKEKGIETLLQAADALPEIPFVFAGSGPLEGEIGKRKNILNRGFLTGDALAEVISRARFSVIPSECYENCPFSVMESQFYGTPVLAADIGGIPELLRDGETGELFESGNPHQLTRKIRHLWRSRETIRSYTETCKKQEFLSISRYCEALERFYLGEIL